MKFQMVEEKSVVLQSHELPKISHEILSEGMHIDEQFQVAMLIDKLPTSWNDFKKELRHKTKEFSMESLITKIRVEEEARKQDSETRLGNKPDYITFGDLQPLKAWSINEPCQVQELRTS